MPVITALWQAGESWYIELEDGQQVSLNTSAISLLLPNSERTDALLVLRPDSFSPQTYVLPAGLISDLWPAHRPLDKTRRDSGGPEVLTLE